MVNAKFLRGQKLSYEGLEEAWVGIGECVKIAIECVDLSRNLRDIVLNLNRSCECESSADEEDKGRLDLDHD